MVSGLIASVLEINKTKQNFHGAVFNFNIANHRGGTYWCRVSVMYSGASLFFSANSSYSLTVQSELSM